MTGGMRFWMAMAAGLPLTLAPILALMTAPALAADGPTTRPAPHAGPLKPGPLTPGPLHPGKSAGVRGAQQVRAGFALIGAGAIIAVVVVAAGSSGGNGGSQPEMQSAPVTTTP
jgi:hypothetical protein